MSGRPADAGAPAPASAPEDAPPAWLDELTPRQIMTELDKYIVGQDEAKKAVAIALRNRWRRQRVPADLREEIMPNNLILIGPTGVGKTEIARRLARLAGAPFVKVEASKFTEVGYVGRDVESMIRDLVDVAVNMVRAEREDDVADVADARVEERMLDLLCCPCPPKAARSSRRRRGRTDHPSCSWRAPRASSREPRRQRKTRATCRGVARARGRSSASCCARGSSRTGRSRWRSATLPTSRG